MEVLFENSYERTAESIKEFCRHIYFRRPIWIVVYCLLGVSLLANVVLILTGNYDNIGVSVLALLILAFPFYAYFKSTKMQIKRDREVGGGKPIYVKLMVADELIQSEASTGGVTQISYAQIKKGTQTKHMILLYTQANLVYLFRKDSFTKGSAADLIAFLKQKGVKIK